MSKAKVKHAHKSKPVAVSPEPRPLPLEKKPSLFPLPGSWIQALIVAVIGIVIYFNSTKNLYALDDGIVIEQNQFVQQGSKGIRYILTKDAYFSYYEQMGGKQELEGGRYRPLSIVTFALEQQWFGITKQEYERSLKDPKLNEQQQKDIAEAKKKSDEHLAMIRHLVNVLLYSLSCVVLLFFLQRYVFPANPDIAFLATLIFLVHPLHTEVVANVKSRDEIMSFLFITLTLIGACKFAETKKPLDLILALVSFELALLSKEYAITLIALIPILLYIARKYSITKTAISVLPYLAVAVVYLLMRHGIIDQPDPARTHNPEVLNNPYLYATPGERLASKIYMPWNYIRLLFFPHPLSSDYSYAHYAYRTFGSPLVWVSLAAHIGIAIGAVRFTLKRHILGFAFSFYLLNFLLISNWLMDIGATMGERLIYHSSLGFAMIIAWCAVRGVEKIKVSLQAKQAVIGVGALAVILLCGYQVIERNPAWKNDYTLFTTDVNSVPNSVLANGNAGAQYINSAALPEYQNDSLKRVELIRKGMGYLQRAVAIHKPPVHLRKASKTEINAEYVNGYLNLGLGSYKLNEFDRAEAYWDTAYSYFPSNPYLKTYYGLLSNVYFNRAMELGKQKRIPEALANMERSALLDAKNPAPDNPEIWYNLGGAYYSVQKYDKAKEAWNKCLALEPDHQQARLGMSDLLYMEGIAYANQMQYDKAREALTQSLQLNPKHQYAQKLLEQVIAAAQK